MPRKQQLPQIADENPQLSELFNDFSTIAGTETGDLLNFTFELRRDGGKPNVYIKKIAGYAAIGNDAGSYGTLAGGIYNTTSGTIKRFVVFDGASNSDIYEDVSGTWTTATRSLTAAVDGYFEQYKTVLYYTNGTDAIQKYDGSSWSSLAAGEPYSGASAVAKYIIEYNNMLILARTANNKNRLWISNAGSPEVATTTFDFPSEITGLKRLGSFYVVTTENLTYIMSGVSPDTMTRYKKLNNIGCVSNRSMVEVEIGGGKELWFVASDASIRAFNGETSRRIGYEDVQNWFPNLNMGNISKCAGVFYKGIYHLAVPYSSSTYNNKIFTCDPRFNRWVRYDNFQAQFLSTYSDSGTVYMWFGEASTDGRVWKYPSGFTTQKPSSSTAITKQFITTNLDGGAPFLIKKFKKMYAQLKAIGAANYQVQANIDELGYAGLRFGNNQSAYISMAANNPLWGTAIWGAFTWGGANLVPTPDNRGVIVGRGKLVKYKFTDSQTIGQSELYYFQHFYIPKKVR